jgi:hypothetical protein
MVPKHNFIGPFKLFFFIGYSISLKKALEKNWSLGHLKIIQSLRKSWGQGERTQRNLLHPFSPSMSSNRKIGPSFSNFEGFYWSQRSIFSAELLNTKRKAKIWNSPPFPQKKNYISPITHVSIKHSKIF